MGIGIVWDSVPVVVPDVSDVDVGVGAGEVDKEMGKAWSFFRLYRFG